MANPYLPLGGILSGHARPADPLALAQLLRLAGSDRPVQYAALRTGDEIERPATDSRRPVRSTK